MKCCWWRYLKLLQWLHRHSPPSLVLTAQLDVLLSGAFSNLKCFLLALIKVLQGGSIALGFGGWNFTKVVPKVTYFPSTHFPDLLRPLLFVFWFNLAPNVNVWGWVGDGSLPPHGALDDRGTQFVGQDLVTASSPVCATLKCDEVKSCLMRVKQLTLFTTFHAKRQLAQAVENKCIKNNVNSRRKSAVWTTTPAYAMTVTKWTPSCAVKVWTLTVCDRVVFKPRCKPGLCELHLIRGSEVNI